MSLNYLTAYYDFADSLCATPVSVINYYPEASYAACDALAANVSGCATSDYYLAYEANCVTYGFHKNGLSVFGSNSFTEVFIYSSPTCSDSSITNLRQYRIDGCYQFSGNDGFGGLSRMGTASVSKSTFDIMIFSDTACSIFYQNVTFSADNSTCQKSTFFNAGNYVKASIVIPSSDTTTTSAATVGDTTGGYSFPLTGGLIGISVAFVAVAIFVGVAYKRWADRMNREVVTLDPSPPQHVPMSAPPTGSNGGMGEYHQQNVEPVSQSGPPPAYTEAV
ncbi:hypothetical protein HDU83_000711 [Entophlyctis luteolus]|nr:hypothetical protein HDU82_007492 [Entophlyctis luteolus]KAJ3349235.1 hypothetical protein HDU83_000711 [Entophlyctis luteolus]